MAKNIYTADVEMAAEVMYLSFKLIWILFKEQNGIPPMKINLLTEKVLTDDDSADNYWIYDLVK